VWTSLTILLIAAAITAGAAVWVLRAYRRAGGGSLRKALGVAAAVALAALTIYLVLGKPELPGQPYRARLEALKARDPSTYVGAEWIALLSEKAKADPADASAHFFLGQLYLGERRPQEAARAFTAALRRAPESPEAMMGLARALIAINDGRTTPESMDLLQQAAARTTDPTPFIYLAIGALEDGDNAAARRYGAEALSRMTADDPRREMARRMSRGDFEAGR